MESDNHQRSVLRRNIAVSFEPGAPGEIGIGGRLGTATASQNSQTDTRLAFGANYTARRLSRHLAATPEKVGFQAQAAAGMGELATGPTDARA